MAYLYASAQGWPFPVPLHATQSDAILSDLIHFSMVEACLEHVHLRKAPSKQDLMQVKKQLAVAYTPVAMLHRLPIRMAGGLQNRSYASRISCPSRLHRPLKPHAAAQAHSPSTAAGMCEAHEAIASRKIVCKSHDQDSTDAT
jgi:hypothetical protein